MLKELERGLDCVREIKSEIIPPEISPCAKYEKANDRIVVSIEKHGKERTIGDLVIFKSANGSGRIVGFALGNFRKLCEANLLPICGFGQTTKMLEAFAIGKKRRIKIIIKHILIPMVEEFDLHEVELG